MAQAVYGIVKDRNQAERIVQTLLEERVPRDRISFLSQEGFEFQDLDVVETNRNWRTEERLTTRTNLNAVPLSNVMNNDVVKRTKAPEGATTGAVAGGIIGGTLGLLAGIGALAIPALGPFIAAGPIMATLSGLGAGGALGGIIGALIGAGIPEFETRRDEKILKNGGVLLSVQAVSDEEAVRVKDILKKQGAEDVTLKQ